MDEKRRIILTAALVQFSTYGFHGTSVDQIVERADVSKGNLLYYFRNKEELYSPLLRELLTIWLQPLRSFHGTQDLAIAIREYIQQKLVASRDNPEASRLFCIEIMQGSPVFGDELFTHLKALAEEKRIVIEQWIAQSRLAPVAPHHLIFSCGRPRSTTGSLHESDQIVWDVRTKIERMPQEATVSFATA
ncbi:Transcriptional regulator RutR of pyrimidine catabolism (TetR family) [Candidatus Paraburkholderia calva]|nr:Transcriptional regulator RutR of pyrimidine catabolism (TetR family) [Candidatus Paraburkholderia calva]